MADLPDSKWGMLERPVLPTIRHVFRGPRELCVQYIKIAEVILGKLRNSMALGSVELATRGVRLPDGTKIRVLRDQSSDILYIDTTETAYAPYKEFPYFDFSFIPKEHYMSPAGDDGTAYLLGDETLPQSDTNPNPKRPMGGYHYTGHPYWKGLPDKAETYPSNKAILWGNQFYFDARGRNLVSWWHSPGGDLPIPIIRPGDYRATRGADVFTLDVNGYLTAVDIQDGPPVYTPIHTTIRRQMVLPNGASAFTLPEFRFGHFTANYRFHILAPQLYRNNSKWDRYDSILTVFDDIAFIAGYTRCMAPLEEDENTYIHASDLLLFTVDTLKQETAPVIYMANFAGIEEGYSSAIFDISSLIADALGMETAFIDQEVTYPWRFNSTGTEAMWIVSVGDRILRGAVTNVRLVWFVFSIDAKNAMLAVTDMRVLGYTLNINSTSSATSSPAVLEDNSTYFFSSEITGTYTNCFLGTYNLEKTEYWILSDFILEGTDVTLSDLRTTIETDEEVPAIYAYSKDDERLVAYIRGQSIGNEAINFLKKEGYARSYWKRTEPYGYWEQWPHTDYVVEVPYWTECPDGPKCVGSFEGFRFFHRILDNYSSYLDDSVGEAIAISSANISLVSNNGLNLKLIEKSTVANTDSLYEAESKLRWKTQNEPEAFIYHSTETRDCTGGYGLNEVTMDLDEYQTDSYRVLNEQHDIIEETVLTRVLTYSNLAKGLIEYKEFSKEYSNTMDYVDSVDDHTSQIHRHWYRYNSSLPEDTGLIITETPLPDETISSNSLDRSVAYELTIKSAILDFINKETTVLYEADAYMDEAAKTVTGTSVTLLTPGYFGTSSSNEERLFYVSRLRQYFDRFSSFSGMVDLSNVEAMRYLYSELHEKAYQMYLHDPVVLGAFFDAFDDQFVCESGIETNTPERDFLLENLPVEEEHRSLYPIALVRNRARLWGSPPTRVEKFKA